MHNKIIKKPPGGRLFDYLYFTAAMIARIASGFVSARVAMILRSTCMFFFVAISINLEYVVPSVRRNAFKRTVHSLRMSFFLSFLCANA